MKTIFVAKVYETNVISLSLNRGRNVGWCQTYSACLRMLNDFGDECRWSYAIIEEISPGMHGFIRSSHWFKRCEREWKKIPDDEWNSFMKCINHAIG
jgi:hypothetical protein